MSVSDEAIGPDHDVVLASDALQLRAFRLDDAAEIYAAVMESKPQLEPWLPWCHADYCLDDTVEFLKGRPAAFQNDGEYAFAIIEQGSDRFVGATGINQVDLAARRANLGYWLRTSATGRGYATTATLMVTRWTFAKLKLERIEIVAAVGNAASQRVAQRSGAQREGIARRRLRVGNVQHDAVVFSLVREDVMNENE